MSASWRGLHPATNGLVFKVRDEEVLEAGGAEAEDGVGEGGEGGVGVGEELDGERVVGGRGRGRPSSAWRPARPPRGRVRRLRAARGECLVRSGSRGGCYRNGAGRVNPSAARKRISHTFPQFEKPRHARRIRAARAGLERPRQAAAVPIPPCVKLIQSSALEAAISIKITYGGIDSATCARRGMIHTVCAFVFAAASKSSSESEAGCRWRLSQYRDRIPASSSLAGTPDLTKRIASGFP